MNAAVNVLAGIGRKLFRFRLLVGLAVTFLAVRWLHVQPFFGSGHQVLHFAGILVIAAGIALRGWGAGVAGGHTRSDRIEAPRLITSGPFAYVRNPIYTGSVLLGVGMTLVIGDPRALLFSALAFAILYLSIIPAEEDFLRRRFGEEYLRYQQAVPRILPRLTPWDGRTAGSFRWRAVAGELVIVLVLVAIYAVLVIEDRLF